MRATVNCAKLPIVLNLLLIVCSAFNPKSGNGKCTVAFSSISHMNLVWKNLLISLPGISSKPSWNLTYRFISKGVSSKLIYSPEFGQPYRQYVSSIQWTFNSGKSRKRVTDISMFSIPLYSFFLPERPFHSMIVVHFISGLASRGQNVRTEILGTRWTVLKIWRGSKIKQREEGRMGSCSGGRVGLEPRGRVIGKYLLHNCDLFMILKTVTKQINRTM